LLAYFGTRTHDLGVMAVRLAGFEIRDTLAHMYGSGFPKSLDVSKAIDKAASAEREVVGRRTDGRYAYAFNGTANRPTGAAAGTDDAVRIGGFVSDKADVTAPATPEAQQWEGWGTALKPAYEPVVVARKPLSGTVAANVLAHGTGALNVDGCRIEGPPSGLKPYTRNIEQRESQAANHEHVTFEDHPSGRWPANVILDEHAAAVLDAQTGELTSGSGKRRPHEWQSVNAYGFSERPNGPSDYERDGDSGGASRFFYVAKASAAESNGRAGSRTGRWSQQEGVIEGARQERAPR
jgi:hypothetical protein